MGPFQWLGGATVYYTAYYGMEILLIFCEIPYSFKVYSINIYDSDYMTIKMKIDLKCIK